MSPRLRRLRRPSPLRPRHAAHRPPLPPPPPPPPPAAPARRSRATFGAEAHLEPQVSAARAGRREENRAETAPPQTRWTVAQAADDLLVCRCGRWWRLLVFHAPQSARAAAVGRLVRSREAVRIEDDVSEVTTAATAARCRPAPH